MEGFQEEKFHALLRCGDISEKLLHDWGDSMDWYMKAFQHSQRAEPIVKIAEHYKYMADIQSKLKPEDLMFHQRNNNRN